MPKPSSKKRALESSGDDSSDSGPDDRNVKKPATSSSKPSKSSSSAAEEENSWQFDKNRFVKVREFKGKVYVDIREFYVDSGSGELKPGKKGISMPVNQWNKLKDIIPEVDAALKKL